jgi:hypothetical protein
VNYVERFATMEEAQLASTTRTVLGIDLGGMAGRWNMMPTISVVMDPSQSTMQYAVVYSFTVTQTGLYAINGSSTVQLPSEAF